MVDRLTARDCCRLHHGRLLDTRKDLGSSMGYDLLAVDHLHQPVWREGLWRGRVCILHCKDHCSHRIHVSLPSSSAPFLFGPADTTPDSILGIVINCGGAPRGGYLGGRYWHKPGAFNHGFKGLCSVFVTAAFAFAGTELVGLAAAETQNPRKSLPTAIKQVFWRITLVRF